MSQSTAVERREALEQRSPCSGSDREEDRMPAIADLFTITEAAEELGLTPSALRSAINYGSLRPVRLDRRTNLIPRAEVERYRRDHLGQRGKRKRKPTGPAQETSSQ